LGDLERQKRNYSAASEYFESAIELARASYIPGWLGNLHLGLAEVSIDREAFDDARLLLQQAEAHYKIRTPSIGGAKYKLVWRIVVSCGLQVSRAGWNEYGPWSERQSQRDTPRTQPLQPPC
jgi:hypothetical protein